MMKIMLLKAFYGYLCVMKNMKRILSLLVVISVFACKDKEQPIKPVWQPVSESVYASGIVKSKNQYEAFSPVNGIIDSLYVTEGDAVKKGSLILSISAEVQRLNQENAELTATFEDLHANEGKLKEAKILIDVSRNKMRNDSLMYTRQRNLWQQQIGSKVEMEQKELAYQNSKANYFSAVVRYHDLKRQLNFNASQSKKNLSISNRLAADYILKSKMDGMVYSLNKEKGEIVSAQTPLAVIGDAQKFILEMQVDEYDILNVRKGLSVLVTLDSYKGKVFEAVVTKINPLMNEQSRTFLVEAAFLKTPVTLYPNISFEANIVLASKKKALLVPRNYVLNDSIVFKRNGDKVLVKTGLKDYQKIEILSGITAADELIIPTP